MLRNLYVPIMLVTTALALVCNVGECGASDGADAQHNKMNAAAKSQQSGNAKIKSTLLKNVSNTLMTMFSSSKKHRNNTGDGAAAVHADGMQPTQRKGTKILLMSDNKSYSHFAFTVKLVNILYNDGHDVHFLVDDHRPEMKMDQLAAGVVIKRVRPDPVLAKSFFREEDNDHRFSNWHNAYYSTEMAYHWKKMGHRAIALYKEVVEDHPDLLTWFRAQDYDLAMAENRDLGAFALFHEIGIRTTIATIASGPLPAFLHFLGLPMADTVPEHYSGGLDIGAKGLLADKKMRDKNAAEYRDTIQHFEEVYATVYREHYLAKGRTHIPPLTELFRRARYFLVNTCDQASLPRPTLPKIQNIGGIAVNNELLAIKFMYSAEKAHGIVRKLVEGNHKVQEWMLKANCLVLFVLGSLIKYDDFGAENVQQMFAAFAHVRTQHGNEQCKFIVKMPESVFGPVEVPAYVHRMDWLPQQQLLALNSVRAVITHCGQNTYIESLYAGVPSVCLPFFGDQRYNSGVAEYFGFGVWVKPPNFAAQFPLALTKVMHTKGGRVNSYRRNAIKIAKQLHMLVGAQAPAEVFKRMVNNAITEALISHSAEMDQLVGKQQNMPGIGKVPMNYVQIAYETSTT